MHVRILAAPFPNGSQCTVDDGVLFCEALARHTEFLRRNLCLPGQQRACLFVTCGENMACMCLVNVTLCQCLSSDLAAAIIPVSEQTGRIWCVSFPALDKTHDPLLVLYATKPRKYVHRRGDAEAAKKQRCQIQPVRSES